MRARSLFSALLLAAAVLVSAAHDAFAAPEKVAGGIRFTYKDANATKVSWAGAFNNWNGTANPMTKDANGVWSVVIELPPGEQQYKFVVESNWFADPENSATAGDFGNSVVRVGASGELLKAASTSNTTYNPKILMGGRSIGLYKSDWNDVGYSRYELERPELDMDLGFDIRMSDVLSAKMLLNVNPRHEDVQDYRSRLNFKRGSMTLTQPDLTMTFFDSEPLGTWDDPLRLVGNEGVYAHPFGYERAGLRLKSPKFGFDTEVLYTDNSAPGGTYAPGFGSFVTGRRVVPVESSGSGYRLVNGTISKATATDVGDMSDTGATVSSTSRDASGTHFSLDDSRRWALRGDWTFAEGDVSLSGGVERQDHTYPAWTQEPVTPAGAPSIYHQRNLNVEYQRGDYADGSDLQNRMTEWKLAWDRNWRYYLGRPVKTTLALTWTNFRYDARTSWEHQLWFPNGNFWLESGQHTVSVGRMTLLGEQQAIEIRPSIEYPIRRSNAMTLVLAGNYATTRLDKKPRFAETIMRFGFDRSSAIRLQTDWRWVKYDVPSLALSNGYLSQFTEAIYRFGGDASVSLGFGVDPWVLDRNTNEYGYIGREMFLEDLHANGWVAETNWFSLAPQLSAAEKRLQNTKRIQLKAIVRF
ncbi:MAG: glycogen-binding domain-containing protein [Candidatus Eisenbacteria bacterium]|nr:glycogen-binding domain-containing protein [Candidatus Eisenbacteria bacterium]